MAIMYQVVIDTNVFVAALRSRRGSSFRLLDLVGDPRWQAKLSVALALASRENGMMPGAW
jgi:predicted nucleic acid-binding protein